MSEETACLKKRSWWYPSIVSPRNSKRCSVREQETLFLTSLFARCKRFRRAPPGYFHGPRSGDGGKDHGWGFATRPAGARWLGGVDVVLLAAGGRPVVNCMAWMVLRAGVLLWAARCLGGDLGQVGPVPEWLFFFDGCRCLPCAWSCRGRLPAKRAITLAGGAGNPAIRWWCRHCLLAAADVLLVVRGQAAERSPSSLPVSALQVDRCRSVAARSVSMIGKEQDHPGRWWLAPISM